MLQELFTTFLDLFSKDLLYALGISSALLFVVSLVAIPYILVRLPSDYFDERYPRTWMKDHHPVLRVLGLIVKNVFGVILALAGVAMLVLPGQGILAILIGMSLLDFPGKRHLEAKLVGQATIFRAINSMRAKFGHPPLTVAPKADKKNPAVIRNQPSTTTD